MRDQWRADDYHTDDRHYRERGRRDRRHRSPAALDHPRGGDAGLKIKGVAKPETISQPLRQTDPDRYLGTQRSDRKSSQSPQSWDRGEVSARRRRRSPTERPSGVYHHRYHEEPRVKHRRSRSRSPRESTHYRDERRRARDPPLVSRIDAGVGTRQDRAFTPPRSPRVEHSSTYDEPPTRASVDSYIPTARSHRSKTPNRDGYRPLSVVRRSRSRSPSVSSRPVRRGQSPLSAITKPSRGPSRRERRDLEIDLQRRAPRHRKPSRSRSPAGRRRKRSPLPTQEQWKYTDKRQKRSRSPYDKVRGRTQAKKMQSVTRPIQSILDDDSRPPSPPRRMSHYGPEGQVPPNALPMHAMHGGDHSRRPPPPHVDTRHQYNSSPQWTPASSHHGSPQSASPYGHPRGGWGGQTPQYHGQPQYVVAFITTILLLTIEL